MKAYAIIISLVFCGHSAIAFQQYATFNDSINTADFFSPEKYHAVKTADRIILPGMRAANAELLQEALSKRYSRSLAGSPEGIAFRAVPKIFGDSPSFARARGIYAELWYAQNNPQIGKVKSPNAPHNDLYARPRSQQPPQGIQIKTHSSGNSAVYAEDMIKDFRARYFVVPDDHVSSLKDYWIQRGDSATKSGLLIQAKQAYANAAKVKPLGMTLHDLEQDMRSGGRIIISEHTAQYVSYGAAVILFAMPAISEMWTTGRLSDRGMGHLVSGGAVAVGTNLFLSKYKGGSLRGTLRGNALMAAAFILVDTGFSIYEYGGVSAFHRSAFYETLAGNIAGASLAFAVAIPVTEAVTLYAAPTLWWAPFIGASAGIVTGSGAYLIGNVGGRNAARCVLETMTPQMLLKEDVKPVRDERARLLAEMQGEQKY